MKNQENLGKIYTDEENFFIEMHATKPIEWIAKKLKRPTQGLRTQMVRLGVSDLHNEAQTYSASGLSEIIGVSHETVRRWILHHGLKGEKRTRYENVEEKHMHYHITTQDFWDWAEQHKEMVQFNKIEPRSLVPEPAWVEEERRKQFYKPEKQRAWTEEESSLLWSLYYVSGLKQREIAERLNRTRVSVERRLRRLREIGYDGKNKKI